MAAITVTKPDTTGVANPAATACNAGGDTVKLGNDDVYIRVKNTNAATRTVTVDSQRNCDQGFDHDIVRVIPATTGDETIKIGPKTRFQNSTGLADISYDAVTNLTIEAFQLM